MTNALGAKPVVDTGEFSSKIKEMNTDLRVLESGFRANVASMGDWAQEGSGLEARIKSLNSQMDVQRNKVALLKGQYENIKQAKGEDAIATKNAEIAYNKANETLQKMGVESKQTAAALEDLNKTEDQSGESAEQAGGKWDRFKSILGGVATVAKGVIAGIAAVGAVAIAAVTAVAGLTFKSAEMADALLEMSAQTGISTERLQELDYAGQQLGTDLETITGANARLVRSMASARDGIGPQAEAFKSLGISVTDASGNLRDSQAVFGEALDALGDIANPTERDALAMQLFGKSAQELNPLIAAGADELARLSEEARANGAIVSGETVGALGGLQDQLDGLKSGLQGVGMSLAGAFAPLFSGVLGQAKGYLQQLASVVSGSGGDFGKMASGVGGLLTQIFGDIASQAPQMMSAGLSIVQSLLTAITSALPQLIPAAISIINTLVQFIIANLPLIITAAIQIIVGLVQGLAQALPTLIPAAVQAIVTIVQALIQNIPMLIQAALELLMGLVQGLIMALPVLIAAVPQIIQSIIDGILTALPMLIAMAPQLIVALITGILGALPVLIAAVPQIILSIIDGIITVLPMLIAMAPQIIVSIITGLKSALPQLWQSGKEIINGMWEGIMQEWPKLLEKLKGLAKAIVDAIKKALGIKSPSDVMADLVGAMIPTGIWDGIEAGMPQLQQQLNGAIRGLSANVAIGTRLTGPTSLTGPTGSTSPAGQGMVVNLNIGTLVADQNGLAELERRLYRVRLIEEARTA